MGSVSLDWNVFYFPAGRGADDWMNGRVADEAGAARIERQSDEQ